MNTQHLLAMAPPPSQGGSNEGSLVSTLVMFAMIIGIFYFLILRPQQKRTKERAKLLEALKKGDKVMTSAGMYGTIVGLDEKTALIQVADNVKIKFDRSAISSVTREGDAEPNTGKETK